MKKYLCFFLSLLSFTTWAKTLVITIGFFQSYPHNYVNSKGEIEGVAVNYMNALAKKAGDSIKYIGPIPFTRIMEKLQQGKIDGAMFLSYKKERLAFLDYMSKPFDEGGQILFLKKDSPLSKLTDYEVIKNWRIGYFAGASRGVLEEKKTLNLQWDELSGDTWRDQNILKLKNGRIDAIYDQSRISLHLTAKKMGMLDEFKRIDLPTENEKLYIAFSKHSRHKQLVERYEKAMDSIPRYHQFEEQFIENH